MQNYKQLLEEVGKNLKKFDELTPNQMSKFKGFLEEVEKDGALTGKQKHLIAIGCSITSHCEWCISYHVKGALDAGASEEEILEATWTAVLMGGGPALMFAQGVLKALEDLKE